MALCLTDVGRRFRGHWAVAHLSFSVPAGRRLLLTGANGAGKTTLLRLLATLIAPSVGAVHLFGQPVAAAPLAPLRRRLGLLTHQHQLYEALSGRENLQLAARLGQRALPEAGAAALARVGLARAGDRPVASYSAGMKRRLGLARLLLGEPELLLLDEPFGQLDAEAAALMAAAIADATARGATLILATHDRARGRSLCDWHLDLGAGVHAQTRAPQPVPLEAA